MTGGSRHRARRAALQALYQWDLTHGAPGDVEAHFIAEHELAGVDLAYFRELIREIPRRHRHLDDQLPSHLDRAFDDVDPVERAILRIGVYELEFHAEIPYRVILDEAVELAKTFGAEHSYRFVNGVLDKVAAQLRSHEAKPA